MRIILTQMNTLKLAVLFGGPSLERGISLNSARSLCDHFQDKAIEIIPIYFDHFIKAHQISKAQLYSNTPSDFDFKLRSLGKSLSDKDLVSLLRSTDIIFPAIHGKFGEDGELQSFLETNKIPFVGSPSKACKQGFDKYKASKFLKKHGFTVIPSIVLEKGDPKLRQKALDFFDKHSLNKAILKPSCGGSSIGVSMVTNEFQAESKSYDIFEHEIDSKVLLEPFCTGQEFTVIVLENQNNKPVSLIPTEIEIITQQDEKIFDFRRKYLATSQTRYHCPPRFPDAIVRDIQKQAESLFLLLGMRDLARLDGWYLSNGDIVFSDFNPISGMEQNSFLFQQAARIGMNHRDLLLFVLLNACKRNGIDFSPTLSKNSKDFKEKISIICGGATSERQVSLMSGTNVWLKLKQSLKYSPILYMLDMENNVWELPYALALNHTVEEIQDLCFNAIEDDKRLQNFRHDVISNLSPYPLQLIEEINLPKKLDLLNFINNSNKVFIALHGGMGEDGRLQSLLENHKVLFSGSDSLTSKLCMDKYDACIKLKELQNIGVFTAHKILLPTINISEDYENTWAMLVDELNTSSLIVKPRADGCSTGVVRLYNSIDLKYYVSAVIERLPIIPMGKITNQHGIIDMPSKPQNELMFEPFIETDVVRIKKNQMEWEVKSGWIEITMGVLGNKGHIHAFNPSLTVSEGNVLALEEKFQGGTGVNITPPPQPFVKQVAIDNAKKNIEQVANTLGISGYARIDAFMNTASGDIIVIEANTNPGLTPSTVIYHQALAETPPLYPIQFLENIIEISN